MTVNMSPTVEMAVGGPETGKDDERRGEDIDDEEMGTVERQIEEREEEDDDNDDIGQLASSSSAQNQKQQQQHQKNMLIDDHYQDNLPRHCQQEFRTSLLLGMAAYRYGSIGYKVEHFLRRLLKRFGHNANVNVSNTDITISVFSFEEPSSASSHPLHPADARLRSNGSTTDGRSRAQGDVGTTTTITTTNCDNNNNNKIRWRVLQSQTVTTTSTTSADHSNKQRHSKDDAYTNNGGTTVEEFQNGPIEDIELSRSSQRHSLIAPSSMIPFTVSVPITDETDLKKLYDLSFICADLLHKKITIGQAETQLRMLEKEQPEWSTWSRYVAYILTSCGFASVLNGNWTDIWLSTVGGTLALLTKLIVSYVLKTCVLDTSPSTSRDVMNNTILMFAAAFVPGLLANTLFYAPWQHKDKVHPTIIILSSIISEVPGFMITKSIMELCLNRILAGLGHFIQSFLLCLWLAFGSALSEQIVLLFVSNTSQTATETGESQGIDHVWYILFAPLLGVCFSVFFSVGRNQLVWSVLVSLIAFGMSLLIPRFDNTYVGNIVAALITTMVSNIWGWSLHNKVCFGVTDPVPNPSSIVLLPAFFILVGGSIGVRGFTDVFDGNGGGTLAEFLLVPLTLCIGIYLGGVLVPTASVL